MSAASSTPIYNEGVRLVREGPRRFAVYSNDHRWGHFRRKIDALIFIDDVRYGRAFFSRVGSQLITEPVGVTPAGR